MICYMIKLQYSPAHFREIADRVDAGEHVHLPLDLKENYFSIFDALASQLGCLKSVEAAKITQFYTICKVTIHTARSDSPYRGNAKNIRFSADAAEVALQVGEEVMTFPRDALPPIKL